MDAEKLLEKIKNPPSWWWKVFGGLLLIVVVLLIKYQLDKQEAEIARLKNQAAAEKLAAEQAEFQARLGVSTAAGKAAHDAALANVAAAAAKLRDVEAKEKGVGIELARLTAIKNKDWDALNKMAGV